MTDDSPATLPEALDFTPVPRKILRRHDGWTDERQRRFIAAVAETGSISAACRAVGVCNASAYNLYNHPQGASFRKAWDRALEIGAARIHDVAMERALDGVPVPVFYKGKQIAETRRYSDRVLSHLLRHHVFGHHPSPVGVRGRATLERQALENCPACRARAEAAAAGSGATAPDDGHDDFVSELFERYTLKVHTEREQRLRGEVVSADFTLRQLTWLEGVLDGMGDGERLMAWWTEQAGQDFNPRVPSEVGRALIAIREQLWADMADLQRPADTPPTLTNGRYGGPTRAEREKAQREAREQIAAAQAMWEAAATEEGWARYKEQGKA